MPLLDEKISLDKSGIAMCFQKFEVMTMLNLDAQTWRRMELLEILPENFSYGKGSEVLLISGRYFYTVDQLILWHEASSRLITMKPGEIKKLMQAACL